MTNSDETIPKLAGEKTTVLFLCSGNFYRSRFAEALFNWLARQRGVGWRAESRGFRLYELNVGPISRHAMAALISRGIPVPEPVRHPQVLDEADLRAAGLIVAVKEAEHRPMMQQRFPDWVDRVDYWHIHDVDCCDPETALAELEQHVQRLLERVT